jgi:hypothetical protein
MTLDIGFYSQLLAALFFVGLLLLPFYWFARSRAAQRWLFFLILLLINLGGLWYLLVSYLVTRLDGSRPPSFIEVLASGLWLPLLILLLTNAALFLIRRRN